MDNFWRLVCVVSCLLVVFCRPAGATITASNVFNCSGASQSATGSSAVDACSALVKKVYGSSTSIYVTSCTSGNTGTCSLYGAGSFNFSYAGSSCPANSTASGSLCNCNSGYGELSGACLANTCPSAGTSLGGDNAAITYSGSTASVGICLSGCAVSGAMAASNGAGKITLWGPIVSTGNLCAMSGSATPGYPVASDPVSGAPAASSPVTGSYPNCSVGKCPGTVTINGATTGMCVACSSTVDKDVKTTASSASSAASGSSTTTTSSSGSTSSSQTTCANGSCTTTTTTSSTNPDGSTGTTQTQTTQSKDDYCAQNPQAKSCKAANDSQWSGTCSAGFTCDADAVQCAQAQASWKSACATDISSTDPLVTAGQTAMGSTWGGNDPTQGGNVDVSTFDQSERYTGSCPQDVEFAVMGHTIAIPVSRACTYFSIAGAVAVAISLVVATRIALGG